MQTSSIQLSCCYDGRDFDLVDEDTVVQLAGAYIVLWNMTTGQKDYIQSPRQNGYAQVTTSPNLGMIAASEYGLQPECHIYKMPEKRVIAQFNMQTTLRTSAMAFSRDGNYLLIVGGVPDFKISIFDIKSQQFLAIPVTKLPFGYSKLRHVAFNPRSHNEFCILSDTMIYFYSLKPAFQYGDKYIGGDDDDENKVFELVDSWRLDMVTFSATDIDNKQEGPIEFHSLKWDTYGRVHLCTNLTSILQITSMQPHVEQTFEIGSVPHTSLLTQKHMIISTDDGSIKWYKIEPPYESPDGKYDPTQANKILAEIDQEFMFTDFLQPQFKAPASYMKYSRSQQTMVIGTQNGVLATLAVEAELLDEDEEEEEGSGKEKQKKTITVPLVVKGKFHTGPIVAIRVLPDGHFITISEDQTLMIWSRDQWKAIINLTDQPISLNISSDGAVCFVGTYEGGFLVIDVRDRAQPRIVKQMRFFEQSIPISFINSTHDGNVVMIASRESDKVFVISQKASEDFSILGFVKMDGYILSLSYMIQENQLYATTVLSSNLVQVSLLPVTKQDDRLNPLPEATFKKSCRKVDRGSNMIISSNITPKFFVTGEDKYLKQYDIFPNEQYFVVDWRKPAIQPNEEYVSHSIGTTCVDFSQGLKKILTGGKDGLVIARSPEQIRKMKEYQIFSVVGGGVAALSVDNEGFIYAAGFDGSIFVVSLVEDVDLPQVQKKIEYTDAALDKMDVEEITSVTEMKLFTEVLKEEFERSNNERKFQFKKLMMTKLAVIQNKLQELLQENTTVTEIERLQREEFCIDVDLQNKIILVGEEECNQIRKLSEKQCLVLELLRERVKESTWDRMEVQQKAIKSIQSDTLLYNFSVRKRTADEQKILNVVIRQRQVELTDKYRRIEAMLKEVLDEAQFTRSKDGKLIQEGYFMNRMPGKPEFWDNDAIALAVEEFAKKEADKKAKRNAEQQSQVNTNSKDEGKRKPYIKISKGKLGTKMRKAADDGSGAQRQQVQARDIKGMEEIHWKVVYLEKELEYLRASLEAPNIYDILYNAFELYTDKRKRCQIELLKECVFELKRDYNKQFDEFDSLKQEQVFLIAEKNEAIKELQQALNFPIDVFVPTPHILEKPDHIFQVDESEIKVERYLTKAERAILAEQERIRLEREALLSGDNVGQRGLREMLGGNELTFKKDKNPLDQEYEREEWMNKKDEDMNDNERQLLKEFLQKEQDYLLKRRKANEQVLKKVQGEILDIESKFEEKLLMLYKKRLFFEARIFEQELYIVRLNVQMHEVRETRVNSVKYKTECDNLQTELETKLQFIQNCQHQMQEFEQRMQQDKTLQQQKEKIRTLCSNENLNVKQILGFVENGKPQSRIQIDEVEKTKMNSHIVILDAFSGIDKGLVKDSIAIKESEEVYDFERDRPGEVIREQFEQFVEQRHLRIKNNKVIEANQKKLKNLKDFSGYLEHEMQSVQQNENAAKQRSDQFKKRLEKMKYNFEVIVYLKQGQVEVPQQPVATDYKNAILVHEEVITYENAQITMRGNEKVQQMININETQTRLKHVQCQNKRLSLEITDFEERSKDVQLYRVTKQTQEIIQGQGKHVKKDEDDKKKHEKQIELLEDSCGRRIAAINEIKKKLRAEIKEKEAENRQLEEKARQLKDNVDQRNKILELKSNQKSDLANDPNQKLQDIADQRKMLDKIKRQEEEIMFLSDELDRLRARTFPSFAHLQSKVEYPDER